MARFRGRIRGQGIPADGLKRRCAMHVRGTKDWEWMEDKPLGIKRDVLPSLSCAMGVLCVCPSASASPISTSFIYRDSFITTAFINIVF